MKKIDDNFSIKLFKTNKYKFVLVEVEVLYKNTFVKKGLMIIDTCCILNIIFKEAFKDFPLYNIFSDQKFRSMSIGDCSSTDSQYIEFSMGNTHFSSEMVICNKSNIVNVEGMPILGIIGNVFLQKNALAIDFSDSTLYKSKLDYTNFCMTDSSFFFDMDLGINTYGVPALLIDGGNDDIIAIVDTGTSQNVLTKKVLSAVDNSYASSNEKKTVSGIQKIFDDKVLTVNFSVNGLVNGGCECKLYSYKDKFIIIESKYILPSNIGSDESQTKKPNIEAVLGCHFMSRNGWVLDFGAMIIYKKI